MSGEAVYLSARSENTLNARSLCWRVEETRRERGRERERAGGPSRPRGFRHPSCPGEEERERERREKSQSERERELTRGGQLYTGGSSLSVVSHGAERPGLVAVRVGRGLLAFNWVNRKEKPGTQDSKPYFVQKASFKDVLTGPGLGRCKLAAVGVASGEFCRAFPR